MIASCTAIVSTAEQGNGNTSSVSSTCEIDNTGDYCFENLSENNVSVEVILGGFRVKSAMVRSGETKCFYSMKTEVHTFYVKDESTKKKIDYGDVIVEQCRSKTYSIR